MTISQINQKKLSWAFLIPLSVLLILVYSFTTNSTSMIYDDYKSQWKEVQKKENEGLTKSARELVEEIFVEAHKEKNQVQKIKCLVYLMKYDQILEEKSEQMIIDRLQGEIAVAETSEKALLNSMLAETYRNYFQQNRYRFQNRTETLNFDKSDFQTWDPQYLVKQIAHYYELSLQPADELKKKSVRDYRDILHLADDSEKYRPTVYDLLAHRAISFFSNEWAEVTRARARFYIDKETFFADAESFSKMDIEVEDSLSLKGRALKIFQKLEQFHLDDPRPEALVSVSLDRLRFVWNNATLPNKDVLYQAGLETMLDDYIDFEEYALIASRLGEYYFNQSHVHYDHRGQNKQIDEEKKGDRIKALKILKKAVKLYPDSKWSKNNCRYLINQIEAKQLNVQMEAVVLPNEPILANFQGRNIDEFYWRIWEWPNDRLSDWETGINRTDEMAEYTKGLALIEEGSQKVALETEDHFEHGMEFKIPDLDYGFYWLEASTDPDFNDEGIIHTVQYFQVSQLSLMSRSLENGVEYYASRRKSSEPAANIKFIAYERKYNRGHKGFELTKLKEGRTDDEGRFLINPNTRNQVQIDLLEGDDQYRYNFNIRKYRSYNNDRKREVTHMFTDRAIYRPGQKVYFKGIKSVQQSGENELLSGGMVLATLYDVNNQEVAQQELEVNEFGSFAGTFDLPEGKLNGNFSIRVPNGNVYFKVEEYKRPKFKVSIDKTDQEYQLGEEVTVKGKALSFAGIAIDNADISYRVIRRHHYPYLPWYKIRWFPPSSEMEIASGTLTTDSEGKFEIKFEAIGDPSIPAEAKAQFTYTVIADVTDSNGETRSGEQYIRIGAASLTLNTTLPKDHVLPGDIDFKIISQNLDGQFQEVAIDLQVYELIPPKKVYRQRLWSFPDLKGIKQASFEADFPQYNFKADTEPSLWENGKEVIKQNSSTEEGKDWSLSSGKLGTGYYRVIASTKDKNGKEVNTEQVIRIIDKDAKTPIMADWIYGQALKSEVEKGSKVAFVLGSPTSLETLVSLQIGKEIKETKWIELNKEQKLLSYDIPSDFKGAVSLHFSAAYENEGRDRTISVNVIEPSTDLAFDLLSYRTDLEPGDKEKWRLKIKGPKGEQIASELMTVLYDKSLDEFAPHQWRFQNNTYRYFQPRPINYNRSFHIAPARSVGSYRGGRDHVYPIEQSWDQLNWFNFYPFQNNMYYNLAGAGGPRSFKSSSQTQSMEMASDMDGDAVSVSRMAAAPEAMMDEAVESESTSKLKCWDKNGNGVGDADEDRNGDGIFNQLDCQASEASLGQIKTRQNLVETAFFFPQIKTDKEGNIELEFEAPETLTSWNWKGFAHSKQLNIGRFHEEITTRKDLMVFPNPPRFFRHNDQIEFQAKVANQSKREQNAQVELRLINAISGEDVTDEYLGISLQEISIDAGASKTVTWPLSINENADALTYKVVAKAGNKGDGEERTIPVMSDKVLVTESLPLPIRKAGTKTFELASLINSESSSTIDHHALTLEFTSNPAWYAVQALPYLMEYPHDCSEQVFNRLYANSLATHIATSNPKIGDVFKKWKEDHDAGGTALLSNLEKNKELKTALLEATPYVLEAQNESERKQRLGQLFDVDRMSNELTNITDQLQQKQLGNGAWPWFKGMRANRYITQYITTGIGRLIHLEASPKGQEGQLDAMAQKAFKYLDNELHDDYRELLKYKKSMKDYRPSQLQVFYFYSRSFFPELKLNSKHQEAYNYFYERMKASWMDYNKHMQAILATTLHRNQETEVPNKILKMFEENSIVNDEMGIYFKDVSRGYYWYEGSVEAQSMIIEAFHEISNDQETVDLLKVWLLKQKQVQDWKTTIATADACYALLKTGGNWIEKTPEVSIALGGEEINFVELTDKLPEAGTGYVKTSWAADEVTAKQGSVEVTKEEDGVAWGALYWQYFEDMDKVQGAETPLKLKKDLFKVILSEQGEKLEKVSATKLEVGDKVRVRIELRSDRTMEYLHMRDLRASGFEPLDVISAYRYQDGLGYYQSTKDVSTDFFFDRLREGTYVFEYDLRVFQAGDFSNGITTIECMYAPEFRSQSEGVRVVVE